MKRLISATLLGLLLIGCNKSKTAEINGSTNCDCPDSKLFSEQKQYYPDSSLKRVFYLCGDQLIGQELVYYPNGQLSTQRWYCFDVKVGLHLGYWESGLPKFKYEIDEFGRYHGEVKEWYASGQLYKHFNYSEGQEVGRQQMWKSDGRIKANYEIKNGEKFGLIGLKRCYTVDSDTLKK